MRGPLYNLSYFRVGYPVLNNMRLKNGIYDRQTVLKNPHFVEYLNF